MATIFTRIIDGEIPCHKLAEDDRFLSFLDVRPVRKGHALVVPKLEKDYIFDHDDELLAAMLPFAAPIARAIESVVPCERIGLSVIGLEVPHTHLHLVPISFGNLIDFSTAREMPPEALAELAQEIRQKLNQ